MEKEKDICMHYNGRGRCKENMFGCPQYVNGECTSKGVVTGKTVKTPEENGWKHDRAH